MDNIQTNFAICSTQLPISNAILKLSGVVASNVCHEDEYTDCFMLGLSNPKEFWKERLTEDDFQEYMKEREYNLIKDDFEDLDYDSYIHDKDYREATLNIIFDERVNLLKNL